MTEPQPTQPYRPFFMDRTVTMGLGGVCRRAALRFGNRDGVQFGHFGTSRQIGRPDQPNGAKRFTY
jgi:hypothetical protein